MLTEKQLQMTAYMEANKLSQIDKNKALIDALELIYEIMTDQINDVDECEKYLREYAPELLLSNLYYSLLLSCIKLKVLKGGVAITIRLKGIKG